MADIGTGFEVARRALENKFIDRFKYETVPQSDEFELWRHWPEIHDSQCEEVCRFLDQYTDPNNSKAQLWVKDPVAGKGNDGNNAVYQGTWRLVGNYYDTERRGTPGVWQILRKGFATTIKDDEWRSVASRGDPNTAGFQIRRVLKFVDPLSLPTAFIDALKGQTTVTTPWIDRKQYVGKYSVPPDGYGHTRADDGSCNVFQDLTLISIAKTAATIIALEANIDFTHDIVRMFKGAHTDYDSTLISEQQKGWVFSYRYLDPENRKDIEAIADSTWITLIKLAPEDSDATKPFPYGSFYMGKRLLPDERNRTITLQLMFSDDEATSYEQIREYATKDGNVYEKEVNNALPAEFEADSAIPTKGTKPNANVTIDFQTDRRGLLKYVVNKRPRQSGSGDYPATGDNISWKVDTVITSDTLYYIVVQSIYTNSKNDVTNFLNGTTVSGVTKPSGYTLVAQYDRQRTGHIFIDGPVRLYHVQRVFIKDIPPAS